MKITFELDTQETDKEEKVAMTFASDNYYLLWELKHNFWRKWKNIPDDKSEDFAKGVEEVLNALSLQLQEYIEG